MGRKNHMLERACQTRARRKVSGVQNLRWRCGHSSLSGEATLSILAMYVYRGVIIVDRIRFLILAIGVGLVVLATHIRSRVPTAQSLAGANTAARAGQGRTNHPSCN